MNKKITVYISIILSIIVFVFDSQAQNSWYSIRSGDWSDARIWTLNSNGPDGVYDNPGGNSIPQAGDKVTISTFTTVTLDADVAVILEKLTVEEEAILEMAEYSFAGFNTGISGNGKVRTRSGLPGAILDDFATSSTAEIEIYDPSVNPINLTSDLPNLTLSLTEASNGSDFLINIFSDITINGNFTTSRLGDGTLSVSIGDDTVDDILTLRVYGDVTIADGFSLITENDVIALQAGRTFFNIHSLESYGNITNNGTIRLSNEAQPAHENPADNGGFFPPQGAVNVILKGNSLTTFSCNSSTILNRLILSKDNKEDIAVLTSSDPGNFVLHGSNRLEATEKSLLLLSGTLRLEGSTNIASLVEGGQPSSGISNNSILHLNGNNVNVSTTTNSADPGAGLAYNVEGKLLVSSGTFDARTGGISCGFVEHAEIVVEGGNLLTSQILGTEAFRVELKGGELRVDGNSNIDRNNLFINDNEPLLHLENDSEFHFLGGILKIRDKSSDVINTIHLDIPKENTVVTGGDLVFEIPGDADPYILSSRSAFYNIQITNSSGANTATVQMNSSIQAKGNLTIGANTHLDANNLDLSIGGDFVLQADANYTPGTNTTTFNGEVNQTVNLPGSVVGDFYELTFDNPSQITLQNNTAIVKNDFTLLQGVLNLSAVDEVLNVKGERVDNRGRIVNGIIELSRGGGTVQGFYGGGEYNGIKFNSTQPLINLNSDILITGDVEFAKSIYVNLDSRIKGLNISLGANASFSGAQLYSNSGFSLDGETHSVSKEFNAGNNDNFFMPLEVGGVPYMEILFSGIDVENEGTVTITPISLPSSLTTDPDDKELYFYWRVRTEGGLSFTSLTQEYAYERPTHADGRGDEDLYLSAYFDPSSLNWVTGDVNDVEPFEFDETYSIISFSNVGNIDGDYTAGELSEFDEPTKFYSISSGDWSAQDGAFNYENWSTDPDVDVLPVEKPGAGDIVFIRAGHQITLAGNENAGFLILDGNLGLGTHTGSFSDVSGRGVLTIRTSEYFPRGIYNDFLSPSGGTVEFNASEGNFRLPNANRIYNNILLSGVNDKVLNNVIEKIHGELRTTAGNSYISNKSLDIGSIVVEDGNLYIKNNRKSNVSVSGNIVVDSDDDGNGLFDIENQAAFPGAETHKLILSGSFTNNGNVDFREDIANNFLGCDITFTGSSSDVDGNGNYTFKDIVINKDGEDELLDINGAISNFSISGSLSLLQGDLRYAINPSVLLSSSSFEIPSASEVIIDNENTIVSVATAVDDASDLLLNGSLNILNGTVKVGTEDANSANDIKYSVEGDPRIALSNSSRLIVNGQVRKALFQGDGILDLIMSGNSSLTINQNKTDISAIEKYRGLEIYGDGSQLEMLGSSRIIFNQGRIDEDADGRELDIYLNPRNFTLDVGTRLELLESDADTKYEIASSIKIPNLWLLGDVANNNNHECMISDNLTVGTLLVLNSTLDEGDGYDLIVEMSFINFGGVYQPSDNTTTFNSSNNGLINNTGALTFNNLIVEKGSNILSLNSSINVEGLLTVSSGTVNDNGNTITTTGNVINQGKFTGGGKILFSGASEQKIGGEGIYGGVEINNAEGIASSNDTFIDGNITFTNGLFNIGNYLLTLGETSVIVGADPATRFINTSGKEALKGVKKIFPAGPSNNESFTWPIGVDGNYVGATIAWTANEFETGDIYFGDKSYITVKPVAHASAATTDDANDTELDLYWIVKADGVNIFGDVTLQFDYYEDAVAGRGDEANYVAAALIEGQWYSSVVPGDDVDEASNTIGAFNVATLEGFDNAVYGFSEIEGVYTAGLKNEFQGIPTYYARLANGNWSDFGSWTFDDNPNNPNPAEAGSIPSVSSNVVIFAERGITVGEDYIEAVSVNVTGSGFLNLSTSANPNLHDIRGNGTVRLSPSDAAYRYSAQANDITDFDGTFKFEGVGDALLPASIKEYETLEINGAGTKRLAVNTRVNVGLNLVEGVLESTSTRKLTLSEDASNNVDVAVSIGDLQNNISTSVAQSYVVGPVAIQGNAEGGFETLNYPIGKDSNYRPIELSFEVAGGGVYNLEAELMNQSARVAAPPAGLENVSALRYWDIRANNPGSASFQNVTATLSFNIAEDDMGAEHLDEIRLTKSPALGDPFEAPMAVTQNGNTFSNNLAFNGFSIVVFGSTNAENNPLPVTWVSFHGQLQGNNVLLDWVTASEVNNSHFEVERSNDGENFYMLGTVKGNGTTTASNNYNYVDETNISGVVYYRLRQVDFDGKYEYSKIISVIANDNEKGFIAYPNPIEDNVFTISSPNHDLDSPYLIKLHDTSGAVLFEKVLTLREANKKLVHVMNKLGSGVFMLSLTEGNGTRHVIQLLK